MQQQNASIRYTLGKRYKEGREIMNRCVFKKVLLTGGLLSGFGLCFAAQAATQVEVGAGLNTIVPYGNVRLQQDFSEQWSGNLALQVGPAFTKTNGPTPLNTVATAGLKYYWLRDSWFQPFVGADVGMAWVPDRVSPMRQSEVGIFGQLGVGADLMFSPHFGLGLALRSNLNVLNRSLMSGTLTLRPEINGVWRF